MEEFFTILYKFSLPFEKNVLYYGRCPYSGGVRNMENEVSKVTDNTYSEIHTSENVSKEKEVNPLKICLVIFIIFIVIPVYCFFSFFGLFPVPKAVIIANFYVNKKHFERMIGSEFEERKNWNHEISANSVTDDEDLKKSISVLFGFNIWDHVSKNNSGRYIFMPYNFTYIRGRGILYDADGDISTYCIQYGRYIFTYKCESLGGGWYYYEFVDKEKEKG